MKLSSAEGHGDRVLLGNQQNELSPLQILTVATIRQSRLLNAAGSFTLIVLYASA